MVFVMKPARAEDLDSVLQLLHDRVEWLRQQGNDQWSTSDTFQTRLAKAIERQQTWLLMDNEGGGGGGSSRPVATMTLRTKGSTRYWTPEELQDPALYIAKMATAVTHRGKGLGKMMISWARDWAAKQGLRVVRWDAWRTNQGLIRYYESLGARHVRTESENARFSGALFDISAQRIPDLTVQTAIYEKTIPVLIAESCAQGADDVVIST